MKTSRGILMGTAVSLFLSAVALDAASYLPLSDKDLAKRTPVIVRATVKGSTVRSTKPSQRTAG